MGWCRGGRGRLLLLWGLLAAGLAAPAVYASDIGELDLRCRSLLKRYVFDCTCTTEFLEQHLGPRQADVLMRLWVHGENGDDQRQEFVNIYLQFGRETVHDAIASFHLHRSRLAIFCGQSGPGIAD